MYPPPSQQVPPLALPTLQPPPTAALEEQLSVAAVPALQLPSSAPLLASEPFLLAPLQPQPSTVALLGQPPPYFLPPPPSTVTMLGQLPSYPPTLQLPSIATQQALPPASQQWWSSARSPALSSAAAAPTCSSGQPVKRQRIAARSEVAPLAESSAAAPSGRKKSGPPTGSTGASKTHKECKARGLPCDHSWQSCPFICKGCMGSGHNVPGVFHFPSGPGLPASVCPKNGP